MNWKSVYCVFTMSECVHREQLWAGNLCTICSQCLRVFIGGHNCYTMSNCQLVIDVLFVHISRALWISKSHFILLQEYVLCTTKLLPLQKLSKPQSTTPSSPSSRPRAHPPPTPPRPPSPPPPRPHIYIRIHTTTTLSTPSTVSIIIIMFTFVCGWNEGWSEVMDVRPDL